jgi:hypothetical protein
MNRIMSRPRSNSSPATLISSIPSIPRSPASPSDCPSSSPENVFPITYNDYGNAILYDSGHYQRNLHLARLGALPFFLLATAIVFLWTRREFGDLAGVMAAALFTTLPNILAFSSIAYTDMAAGSTSFCFSLSSTGSTRPPNVPRYGWA